jgi:hypothetical protein
MHFTNRTLRLLLLVFALVLFQGVALADTQGGSPGAAGDPLLPFGTWETVDDFNMSPVPHNFPEIWTFTSTVDVLLTVTDLYVVGDSYNVYDNAVLVLNAPWVTDWSTIAGCNGDPRHASCHYTLYPNVALTDPFFAHGSVLLGPGSHSITLTELTLPTGFTDGTYGIRADPVPEPATLTLFGLGVGALGLIRRRWGKKA